MEVLGFIILLGLLILIFTIVITVIFFALLEYLGLVEDFKVYIVRKLRVNKE